MCNVRAEKKWREISYSFIEHPCFDANESFGDILIEAQTNW